MSSILTIRTTIIYLIVHYIVGELTELVERTGFENRRGLYLRGFESPTLFHIKKKRNLLKNTLDNIHLLLMLPINLISMAR